MIKTKKNAQVRKVRANCKICECLYIYYTLLEEKNRLITDYSFTESEVFTGSLNPIRDLAVLNSLSI